MSIADLKIDFPCPECGQKFEIGLYRLLERGAVVCPRCQVTTENDISGEIEHGLKELGKSLKNLERNRDGSFCFSL